MTETHPDKPDTAFRPVRTTGWILQHDPVCMGYASLSIFHSGVAR